MHWVGCVIYWYSQTSRPVHKLRFPLSTVPAEFFKSFLSLSKPQQLPQARTQGVDCEFRSSQKIEIFFLSYCVSQQMLSGAGNKLWWRYDKTYNLLPFSGVTLCALSLGLVQRWIGAWILVNSLINFYFIGILCHELSDHFTYISRQEIKTYGKLLKCY